MPVNLSIKNAPDDIVKHLRERAARHHRSLNGELLAILEDAVYANRRLPRGLTVEQAIAKLNAIGISTPSEGTAIIRAARDSR